MLNLIAVQCTDKTMGDYNPVYKLAAEASHDMNSNAALNDSTSAQK